MAGVVPLGLEFLLFNRAGGRGCTALFALAFFLTVPVVGIVPLYLRLLLFQPYWLRNCTARLVLPSFLTVLAPEPYRFICACFFFNRTGSATHKKRAEDFTPSCDRRK